MARKIIDRFTDLSFSRQYKHQLRYPEHFKIIHKRYHSSKKAALKKHEWYVKHRISLMLRASPTLTQKDSK